MLVKACILCTFLINNITNQIADKGKMLIIIVLGSIALTVLAGMIRYNNISFSCSAPPNWFGLLGFNASATTRVISRR